MEKRFLVAVYLALLTASCSSPAVSSSPTSSSQSPSPQLAERPTSTVALRQTQTLAASDSKMYDSATLHVTFEYPQGWGKDNTGSADYSGSDGFFSVSGTSQMGVGAADFCQTQIDRNGTAKFGDKYGTSPRLETLAVDGQPACIVLPSNDQPKAEKAAALLVVEYPSSIREHALLFLYADKDHILGFADTLKFTS